jgi:hypothetical protein
VEFTEPLIWYSKLLGESEPQARVEKKKSCLVAICLVDCPNYLNSPLYNTTPVRTIPRELHVK